MRLAVDSITGAGVLAGVRALPGASVVMGYDDGNWPDASVLASMFPGMLVIRITTNPNDNEGDMLDVETGDATPASAPAWTQRRRAAGHGGPLTYFPDSWRQQVIDAYAAAGVHLPGLFAAAYPGRGAVLQEAGDVGHQYASNASYDTSVVIDYLPGIDKDPAPSPTPIPTSGIVKPLSGRYGMLNAPVVAVLCRPDGQGYHEVAADGGTFDFNCPHIGSLAGVKLNAPIVDADLTPSGNGIIMAATDGGVFSFGDAPFDGSEGGKRLNAPVVSIKLTPTGKGYWLAGADGGIFAFGDAPFHGSAA